VTCFDDSVDTSARMKPLGDGGDAFMAVDPAKEGGGDSAVALGHRDSSGEFVLDAVMSPEEFESYYGDLAEDPLPMLGDDGQEHL